MLLLLKALLMLSHHKLDSVESSGGRQTEIPGREELTAPRTEPLCLPAPVPLTTSTSHPAPATSLSGLGSCHGPLCGFLHALARPVSPQQPEGLRWNVNQNDSFPHSQASGHSIFSSENLIWAYPGMPSTCHFPGLNCTHGLHHPPAPTSLHPLTSQSHSFWGTVATLPAT